MEKRQSKIISAPEAIAAGLTYYFSGKPCKHGHISWRVLASRTCSVCAAKACNASYHKNLEKNRERRRQRTDPIKNRKKANDWRLKHPQRASKRNKEWRLANPVRIKENRDDWNSKNPEKVKIGKATNRAKRKNVEGKYGVADIRRIMKDQQYTCVYCPADISEKYHVDHIIPMSRGGTNWPRNIQLCCPRCNLSKAARDPIKFAQEIGLLI